MQSAYITKFLQVQSSYNSRSCSSCSSIFLRIPINQNPNSKFQWVQSPTTPSFYWCKSLQVKVPTTQYEYGCKVPTAQSFYGWKVPATQSSCSFNNSIFLHYRYCTKFQQFKVSTGSELINIKAPTGELMAKMQNFYGCKVPTIPVPTGAKFI